MPKTKKHDSEKEQEKKPAHPEVHGKAHEKSQEKPHHIKPEDSEARLEEKYIDEGLHAIYGNHQVDFTKLDRSRSWITNLLISAIVFLSTVAILGWGGFYVYTTYFQERASEHFSVVIEAPTEITSGSETSLLIRYKNPSSVPLARLTLDVRLPPNLEVSTFQPEPDKAEERIWEIGELAPGSEAMIRIDGIWAASIPSSTPVQVFATYRPANFNADFQEIQTAYITTLASRLSTEITAPEEGRSGEKLAYALKVKNDSSVALHNIRTELALPEGFFLEKSEPAIESGKPPVWDFEEIPAGEEKEITFSGSFASNVSGFQYFDASIALLRDEQTLFQAKTTAFTDVIQTGLSLALVANGTSTDTTVHMGDNVRLSIAIENTGEAEIEDLELTLDMESEKPLPFVWSAAELSGGVRTQKRITWKSVFADPLPAKEKRLIHLILPVEKTVDGSDADRFTFVAASAQQGALVRSSPITVQINTEAKFSAEARYYSASGAPIGSGSIPPKVGSATTYKVFWKVENALHALEQVEMKAVLPPTIRFENQIDSGLGDIRYDEASRTVSWTIPHLPNDIQFVEASFALGMTPTEDQVGKFVKILSGTSFRATDTVTKAILQRATDTLDTELPNDKEAAGKGVVEE